MREFEFPGRWGNFATTSAFFLIPNVLLIWVASYCFWRRWAAPFTTLLVATTAIVAPLAVVMVGWDLSRFLCWSTVAAGVAVVAIGSPTFVSMREEPVLKRAVHTFAISVVLATAALFYTCAPTVYAYFSEVRLSYSRVPDWFIKTAPARLTASLFADYSEYSPLVAGFRKRASCALTDDAARRLADCAHEVNSGSRVYGPSALKLIPGLYVARFEFSATESCTGGELRLGITATGRFGKLLASHSVRIQPPQRIDVPFTVKPIDAGFSDIEFSASGIAGCVVLRRLDFEGLNPDTVGRPFQSRLGGPVRPAL